MRRLVALALALGLAFAAPPPARSKPAGVGAGADERAFERVFARVPAGKPMPALVASVGRSFLGRPYNAHTLDAYAPALGVEPLTSRLDAFDCVTFVESSLAIARAIARREPRYGAFRQELERLRYRNGVRGGYGSRLHYFSEWIADNARRGLLRDLTPALGGRLDARPLHFMSAHRAAYAPLRGDRAFGAVLEAEAGLARLPRRVIPKARLARVIDRIASGDIVGIATNLDGLDVVHVGLAWRLPDGSLHLLHAPEPGRGVCVSRQPLVAYLQGFSAQTGVMIARPLAPTQATSGR